MPKEVLYPLSLNQQRLWFIEEFQPGTPLYNVTRAIRMRGPLNREALRSALQSLVDRHESLRTTFRAMDGEPVQQINAPSELRLPVLDLRMASGDGECAESSLQTKLTAEGRRTFNLSRDLMLRAVLYQIAEDEHVLQVTIHHLACDGWSLRLLFGELTELYRRCCSHQVVELPPTRIRYVDFARWQRDPHQSALFAERAQWWKQQLASAPMILELATDRPRPEIVSGSGAFQPLDLPSELIEQLEVFSQEEQATRFMTLLTGFFILLHRYTGMDGFLVGTSVAGRHRPETIGTVGFFVETVALRADLSGEPTARQVLRRVRRTITDAVKHSDVPFDRVVESLAPPRDLSRHPLFQVHFNAPPQYALELDDLDVSPVNVDLRISRFDLEMTYADGANRATGVIWNSDLFDVDAIERMLGHYVTLLDGIVADADQRINELPLLTPPERQQLLVAWNDTAVEYPQDKCLHDLFEEQVARTPDAVAVVFKDQQLTYRELNARANQLAHRLQHLGVGPETLVGLCLERSPELVIAILAILKAGGAYLPLDPDYPPERLRFLIEDSQPAIVITTATLAKILPATDRPRLCLDQLAAENRGESCDKPADCHGLDDLAYVMYTSGSTGQPKGVRITHRAICNRLLWMQETYRLSPEDRVLQKAPFSFDVSVWEFFWPLLTGARLVMARPGGHRDARYLAEWIIHQQITTLHFVPSMLQVFLEAELSVRCRSIRRVICSGESLPYDLLERFFATLHAELHNLYGPTEAAVDVTSWECRENDQRIVAIGKPVANTQCYILDRYGNPVPIGVPGELHVGGVQLARDYLNRPQLTAEKFIPDPFSMVPGTRLYTTGDLCCWQPDGNIRFLGRLDQQVKIRGFRIEPGEVESLLNDHPSVAQCVIVLREDRVGDMRLVAYYVSPTATALSVSELRSHLRKQLPDYMVPATFVPLDSLPLTPNGKINRRALPTPGDSRPDLECEYVAPRTRLEEQLASIWRDLLGLERVGIHDNFFYLGGNSLLVMRVINRIETATGVRLRPSVLFVNSEIHDLARVIHKEQENSEHQRPRAGGRVFDT